MRDSPRRLSPASLAGEADDERSDCSGDDDADAGARLPLLAAAMKPLPSWPGEDVRPTSPKELWGWYSYGFAAETYVVCGVAAFIPVTLEQLARENGVLLSDRSTPCAGQVQSSASAPEAAGQCVVRLFGADVNTASFAMYTFSLSVLVQALLIISMSGAADHGRYRKTFLVAFALVGSVATMLFLPVTPAVFLLGALLAIVSNTCFGASFVLLNSFLPLLVRQSPAVQNAAARVPDEASPYEADPDRHDYDDDGGHDDQDDPEESEHIASSTSALLPGHTSTRTTTTGAPDASSPARDAAALEMSSKLSANGIGIGYIAAFIVQLLSMLVVSAMGGSLLSLRLVLFLVGAWWLVFTLPAALWLRPRPGPPLKLDGAAAAAGGTGRLWLRYLTHSWKSLFQTVRRARRLRDVLLFLAAWFLLSDAIATISGTAILFAKTTLQMRPTALALINATVMLSGMLGAFFWRAAAKALRLSPLGTVLASLALFALIPLYALLGFVPGIPLGLRAPWEMYPLALVYGLVLGGLSSYCRALFGALVPPGSEAAFFALYAITDKGSSVLGPAVVGAIIDRYGEIRPAFVFLAALVVAPGLILAWVDVERGAREARAAAGAVAGAGAAVGEDAVREDDV